MNDLTLISTEELARQVGYEGPTNAFRSWCAAMRIKPVPGRRGFYDPKLVRRRLDEAQGLASTPTDRTSSADDLIGQRRARRGEG
jgi:hypothetical protein